MSEERQSAATLAGTVLDGSYRIERMLGEGGMGAVYHATQLRLDKPVAIKVMARELSLASEALARFHREALVTSNLGHPNIVQVFDFSTMPTGEPFLVMEYLDGEDLERRLRREGRLSPGTTLHILKQVGAALMATHAKGIVHRDLKPGNIYLLEAAGAGDFVKVLDFGISKVRSATTKLTRTASIMGTPAYMSPEQARGRIEDIDETTDQWALACIAWECVTGEPPFQAESPLATLFQVVNEPPPPLLPKVPGIHPKVEDVLLRALAKKKNERFTNIGDFLAAFEAAVAGTTLPSLPRTLQVSKTALDTAPAERSMQPTTFSRTAGELNEDLDRFNLRSRAWIWAAAGTAVLLLVGGLLLLRSGPGPKSAATSPSPAAPLPATPPVAPESAQAPVAAPAETAQPQPPRAAAVVEADSMKPDGNLRAPQKKQRIRGPAPADAEVKRTKPARRPVVPRMIEDL